MKGGKAKLAKDTPMKPGFLGRGGVKTVEAKTYASWNKKSGPDNRSTKISLPGSK